MFRSLYNLGIYLFVAALWVLQPLIPKARKMIAGRRTQKITPSHTDRQTICVHCASLGEFEQGRPLIEALRAKYPEARLVLTFFSPSGYDIRHNYSGVDDVYYLPFDTVGAVRRMLDLLNIDKFFIVKYEYWYNLLRQLNKRGVELYLVSAIFGENSSFFAPVWKGGAFYRQMLGYFTHIFVQDQPSADRLSEIGFGERVTVAGDTRFDRVAMVTSTARDIEKIVAFTSGAELTIVCGSTWGADEDLLVGVMKERPNWKFIVVPHEISDSRIERLIEQSGRLTVRYSEEQFDDRATLMVVDTIGLLSSIYRYGHIAYIGGGFGAGIHNTLEAATWGMPVVFGPRFERFKEAVELVETGAARSIGGGEQLLAAFDHYASCYDQCGVVARRYVEQNLGATQVIVNTQCRNS